MTDTDLDIILAIADGTLTGQAKQDALARIAADPELGEELAVQISTMNELKSLEPARMTTAERETLRSTLVEQLHLVPTAPPMAETKRSRPWWQPVLGIASAAALLLAIVAVPSLFSGSDSGSADVAIAPDTTTPNSAATQLGTDSSVSSVSQDSASVTGTSFFVLPQIAEEDVQDFFTASTLALGDTTATTLADELLSEAADDESEDESATTLAAAGLLATPDQVAVNASQIRACLTDLSGEISVGEYLPVAATIGDDVIIVHLGVTSGDGVDYSVSIDLESCAIVSITP
jgi:hypothetical protein